MTRWKGLDVDVQGKKMLWTVCECDGRIGLKGDTQVALEVVCADLGWYGLKIFIFQASLATG